VARRAGDPRLLLDFLERQAARPTATAGQIKEAVHAAFSQGEDQRGEALLAEAITRGGGEGADGPTWARIALADHRAARGELEEARDLLHQIAGEVGDASGNQRVLGLGLSIAERAAKSESGRPLAAEIYEFLRAREPGERRVWEPLLDVYRDLGDEARRSAVVGETLPQLVDTGERNALRKKHAEHLVAASRLDEAAQVLRDALLDDPDDLEAGARLEEVYRESGDSAGLAEFLWQRFEEARERGAVETVAAVALRLGAILDDIDREQARAVFHAALEAAPENRDLLEAVLAHEPEENAFSRADIMERLLAVESPDRAPSLVAELAGLREGMEDTDGLIRALELGNRVAPGDDGVRQRLEELYRSLERHDELAEFLVRDAAALEPEIAVERLREAAALCRDVLVDLGRAAAVLDTARALRPDDSKLAIELARTQREAGDLRAAIATVAAALVEPNQGDGRVDLLIHRAELLTELGELGRAVTDLEDAYRLESERVGEPLIAGLERLRVGSRDSSDAAAERRAAMRLATLLGERDRESEARELLLDWINRHSGDREVLFALRAMDIAAERWDGVIAACDQLVQILSGADQLATADQLADAAERLGKPELARSGLELVLRAQPTSEPVRAHLRALYDRTGAYRELAELLLSDADLADDDDVRYGRLRHAADVFVNDLNDPAAAQEPASRARELRPDDHDTVILLADVLIASGQYDAAREMLEPAIGEHRRRSPELAQLQQRMGRLHGALGDRDGQLTWIKKAFDVDRKSGPIAAELAQLATDMGQYDLALKPLRAITLMDDPSPITRVMALLWEAKIEHARGNLRKAEMWAKKALREDPAYSDAQDFLATLSN
jgi:tetratricopeptide (TPR) repeat protein